MSDYYAGQTIVVLTGVLAALFLVFFAVMGLKHAGQPAHAFGITTPLIAGGFMLKANIGYFFYVGPQSTRIESLLKHKPAEFRTSEEAHLEKTFCGFR